MSSSELTVTRVGYEEFCRLEQDWDELVLSSRHPLPFLCHTWLRVWWQHFGDGQRFMALVVRDGSRLLAGVPLALRPVRHLGLSLTLAEIVGTGPVPTRGMGLADKIDFAVREDQPAALDCLCAGLVDLLGDVQVLEIKGLQEASPVAERLAAASLRSSNLRAMERSSSPYLPLPSNWDAYLGSRSGNFRKHLRKYWRKLGEIGTVEALRLGPEDDCRAWMSDALEVNQASWKASRGTNLFRHPKLEAFFLDLADAMARKGWFDLHLLRLDGRTVAYEYCFDFGGRVFSYNGSFLPEYGKLSPGTALTAAVLQAACERGRIEYDMLRGEEEYKARWSDECRHETHLVLPARSLLARQHTFWAISMKSMIKRSPWMRETADRIFGLLSRIRHGSG